MIYQDYIDLGFTRVDTNDSVEYNRTGYHGFILSKQINERVFIELCAGEFDRPKLYIKKSYDGGCHIFTLTGEAVRDMFIEDIDYTKFA